MISNRWNGERISLGTDTPVPLIQTHLSRYAWAMWFCAGNEVVDIGCGSGYGTWLLSTVSSSVLGIDKCPEAIEEAVGNFGCPFICTTLEQSDIGKQFDVVVCFEVLEHLPNLDVGMTAISDYMKDDGVALISLPLHQPSVYHHKRDFGYQQWKAMLSQYFNVGEVYYQAIEHAEDGNNVCIEAAGHDVGDAFQEDWHGCGLRFEPETGVMIFVCTKKVAIKDAT